MMRPARSRRDVTDGGRHDLGPRTVELPPGRTLRAGRVGGRRSGRAARAARASSCGAGRPRSRIRSWSGAPGSTRSTVPGPLLLSARRPVDSLRAGGGDASRRERASRVPPPTPVSGRSRGPSSCPAPATTPFPLILLLLAGHRSCSRRSTGGGAAGAARLGSRRPPRRAARSKPPLERWADAGESRAVAAAATSRLRAALAARLPGALPGARHRGGAGPRRRAAARLAVGRARRCAARPRRGALRQRRRCRMRIGLARWAAELEPRLVQEAA